MIKKDENKPEPQFKNFDIKITSDGNWYHEGGLIKRQKLVALFAKVLSCDAQGQHWLRTPVEYGPIEVEDAAFIITAVRQEKISDEEVVIFTDNLDREYQLGQEYKLFLEMGETGQIKPYLSLDKGVRGRLAHPVYYELAAMATHDEKSQRVGIYSAGIFFPLDTPSAR